MQMWMWALVGGSVALGIFIQRQLGLVKERDMEGKSSSGLRNIDGPWRSESSLPSVGCP